MSDLTDCIIHLLREAHDSGYANGYQDGQVDSGDAKAMDRGQPLGWTTELARKKVNELLVAALPALMQECAEDILKQFGGQGHDADAIAEAIREWRPKGQ